jgi:hypothetical protein
MTKDDFEYYSDDDFAWIGILNFYKSGPFENKKGTIFRIEIELDENTPLDSDDKLVLSSLVKSWTWGEDRKIKAFKLLNHNIEENLIDLNYITIRKSKEFDEIKYFLFDIGSFLSYYDKGIVSITVEKVADEN